MSSIESNGRLAWFLNRLSCMSATEVFYRGGQSLTGLCIKYGLLPSQSSESLHVLDGVPIPSVVIDETARQQYLREADGIIAGSINLFASHQFEVGRIPDWNRDPVTGVVGPRIFSGDIMLTDRSLVGDIKYLWELNRQLQLVRLAQAYVLSGSRRYVDALVNQLDSWMEQCPPFLGPNWASSLEGAIRLINWSLIWNMIGGWTSEAFDAEKGANFRTRWLACIFAHCRYIEWNLSRHSSANNHLLGELAGLYVAAQTWPCWRQSAKWAAQAKAELETQATLQFAVDGVNREQAFSYHVFSSEFLMIAGITGQRSGDSFTSGYWESLQRAVSFVRSIQSVSGRIPMVGDADDGALYLLEPGTGPDRHLLLLELGKALAGVKVDEIFLSDQWLLADLGHFFPFASLPQETSWKFPQGGYFLFGSDFSQATEVKGMVDCGPLGYLGIAAHGHADALALTLSVCGEECLVDPGTFSYWNELKWRDYFRGTSAHNTVMIDGYDQSVSGGRFMWTRKGKACVVRVPLSPEQFDFEGAHDGYMRLADPVRHVRKVCYDHSKKSLLVSDTVLGKAVHVVEQFWHFAPEISVELSGRNVVIVGKRFRIRAEFTGGDLALELVRGREEPPLGWFSRTYESKEPITVLRVFASSSTVSVVARFAIEIFQADS